MNWIILLWIYTAGVLISIPLLFWRKHRGTKKLERKLQSDDMEIRRKAQQDKTELLQITNQLKQLTPYNLDEIFAIMIASLFWPLIYPVVIAKMIKNSD